MKKLFITFLFVIFLINSAFCDEVGIVKKSGNIHFTLLKEYKFESYIKKFLFDEQLKLTHTVTKTSADFYDENERVKHKEPINGRYGNIYFSDNKEYFAVINFDKVTKLTEITLMNKEFEKVWSNSFKFLSTKRIYISDDGKNVIHYGVSRTRGYAALNFIGAGGEALRKTSGFKYVRDSFAFSPKNKMILALGETAYDLEGNVIWQIQNKYKKKKGVCNISPDGSAIVGVYQSDTPKTSDILFIQADGAVVKKHVIKETYDAIIKFSPDNKHCIIFTSGKINLYQTATGKHEWEYDLSAYKTGDEVELIAFSIDISYDSQRIVVAVVPRRLGLYLSVTYLVIFNESGAVLSESVIEGMRKISNFPPAVRISQDGNTLALKFDKLITKYSLTPLPP